ncbi:hypothetical protein SAMN04490243_1936 [Robiginitalea myxolifaciens]|uniref:Uncharacterized protein n=1 Tax=Robiginitalea myxolifaciens TaxID=400055 RepID=A0A1I6GZB1_9FLAO|nr:hypothetical protein [Robiginitalea myxolifaciens]SFR47524.1 hypothetical protein SAMN04490243_1936 [Robiginitalea myxolifaciens]
MKKRKIDIALLAEVKLGTDRCRANELLSYLSSISPKALILNGLFVSDSISDISQLNKVHRKVLKRIQKMAQGDTVVHIVGKVNKSALHKLGITEAGGFRFSRELTLNLHGQETWILPAEQVVVMRNIPMLRYLAGIRDSLLVTFFAGGIKSLNRKVLVAKSNTTRQDKKFTDLAVARNHNVLISSLWAHEGKQWNVTRSGNCLLINSGAWSGKLTALEYAFKRWKLYRYSEDKLPAFFADEELKHMTIRSLLSNLGRSSKAGLL